MSYAAYILATLLQRNAIALANGEIWFGQVSPAELDLIRSFDDAIADCGVTLMVQSEPEHYLVGIQESVPWQCGQASVRP